MKMYINTLGKVINDPERAFETTQIEMINSETR